MAFITKVWKNRLVEFAGRRKLKNVATGEEIIFDVSRSEGVVSQAGDAFSDANMNNLEQRIKNQFDTIDSNLGGVKLVSEGSGTNAKYYAQIGADTSSKKPLGSPAILEVNVGGFTVHAGNNNTLSLAEGVGTVLSFTAFKNLGYNFVQISPWVGSVLQYNITSGNKVSLETVESLSYSGLIYTKEVFLSVPAVVLTFSK